jgi:hypothetical protein
MNSLQKGVRSLTIARRDIVTLEDRALRELSQLAWNGSQQVAKARPFFVRRRRLKCPPS